MQDVGRAPTWACQSAIHAAQDEESRFPYAGDVVQKRKRWYTFYTGVGKGKDADLGLCQDGSRTNKRGEAERDRGPR